MTSISRHLFARAIAAAAVMTALGLGAGVASAQTTPPVPAPTSDGATAPTDPNNEVVASWTLTPGGSVNGDEAGSRPNLSYQVAPGTVIDDTVIVFNLGNVPLQFRIYATDAFNNADGQFDLLPGDKVPVDAGSWVSLAQESLVLPPGKQATIPIKITVPVDATPGDHVGAIVAANTVVSDNGSGPVVNVERRTGTRMYIQVDGPLVRELAVTDVQTKYNQAINPLAGSADVTFRIENRGNVVLGGKPTVAVSGPFGIGKQTVELSEITPLLPGQKVDLSAKLDNVPAAFVDFTTVTVNPVSKADVGGVQPAVGKDRFFAPPIAVLLIMLIIFLGFIAWRAYRRHSRGDGESDDSDLEIEVEPDFEPQIQ